MLPFLNIFGLALPIAPFTYLISIWFGLSLAEKNAQRYKIAPDTLYNLIFTALIAGIVGARLSYIAQFPDAFLSDPGSILSINFGLFDLPGGVIVGIIAALVYGQRKNMAFWPTLDALTPAYALFMVAIPIANLASGFAYGAESSLPWAIELWGAYRHPVQIYEAITAGLVLWYFWPGRKPIDQIKGTAFLQFVAITALARLFFEVFRGDSLTTVYNIRWAQVIAWIIAAAAIWGYNQLTRIKVQK